MTSLAIRHTLKTLPDHFDAVWDGRKRAEIRRDDRGGFEVGQIVKLQEWLGSSSTGRTILIRITHVLTATDLHELGMLGAMRDALAVFSFDVIVRTHPEDAR